MPIEITMPALSPTMEEGNLARWLKKVGDPVRAGDVLAEIETDKATMEVEAIDEGTLAEIRIADGTEGVKVGTVIGVIRQEGEDAAPPASAPNHLPGAAAPVPPLAGGKADPAAGPTLPPSGGGTAPKAQGDGTATAEQVAAQIKGYGANPAEDTAIARAEPAAPRADTARINASPLARRLAEMRGVPLAALTGTGPGGRIVKADVDAAAALPLPLPAASQLSLPPVGGAKAKAEAATATPPPTGGREMRAQASEAEGTPPAAKSAPTPTDIPHEAIKLTQMRKIIARRLTESKQTVPHYYLAIDCRLDALLKLRAELNAAQPVKLSVNDLLIKALAVALMYVPDANVSYTGETLIKYQRADISVAVAIPAGLITPIIVGADSARLTTIATNMKDLAARAKDGKLQPHEYQGGTASLSNLGMYGIKQFEAVINPPQGMILAVGAGDRRPWVEADALTVATVLTATGSFDHRAIDGAVGAQLMAAVRDLIEKPLGMLA